jgi:predicted  nucleic acid-binding Zn-ribbon protein
MESKNPVQVAMEELSNQRNAAFDALVNAKVQEHLLREKINDLEKQLEDANKKLNPEPPA